MSIVALVGCSKCGAGKGERCKYPNKGKNTQKGIHSVRMQDALVAKLDNYKIGKV